VHRWPWVPPAVRLLLPADFLLSRLDFQQGSHVTIGRALLLYAAAEQALSRAGNHELQGDER